MTTTTQISRRLTCSYKQPIRLVTRRNSQWSASSLADELFRATLREASKSQPDSSDQAQSTALESAMVEGEDKLSGWEYLKSEVPYGVAGNARSVAYYSSNQAEEKDPEMYQRRKAQLRSNAGAATVKEKSIFESLFGQVLKGRTEGQKETKKKEKRSTTTSGKSMRMSSAEGSMVFRARHRDVEGVDWNSSWTQKASDPLSWMQISNVETGVEAYPPSLRELSARVRRQRGEFGELPTEYMDRDTEEAERDRIASLKGMIERMRSCRTDTELDAMLEREVYQPFKHAAAYFERTNKEIVMAPNIAKNYPYLLTRAMQIMVSNFHDAYGAFSVFDRARNYGIQSYIMGCTIDVYNEVLQLKWDYFMDLFGCKTLLEEMIVNGVEANSRTASILKSIRTHIAAKEAEDGEGHLSALTKEAMVDGASYRNIRFA
ncbi:hypothetical protein POJ06DRAFT_254838 [Lipomyces tetrasporus]|uniref:Mtf2-like C-terminal domain-containing protein n=1 Tax=Lipomyces tetrasporus TaxID=54092 RepID=A0AAD7QRC8_9ASCO|nr:uncharacterized protein POJ06DRAFT_254838 [Lipomyces tetrasporus]KAJ8099900.1 hypothetical protein POJ06DRAFT_254838 [Lipomyces tetrasporus]